MKLYELYNVKKSYGSLPVLDIPSLTLDKGKSYVFYGPNASGKTTLLNLLARLSRPTEGRVVFHGEPKDATLVMQNPYIFKTTVLKNVAYGLSIRYIAKDKIEKIARPIMEELGLWDLRNRDAVSLSEGQKKKIAVARAIVLDTKALLLDEPTAHLDKIYINTIEDVLCNIAQEAKRTIIMTTHDLNQAHRLTTNVIYLHGGKIAKPSLWNLFSVNLVNYNGIKKARMSDSVEIYVATEKSGKRSIAVSPRDIIISQNPIHSSALNNLKGRIVNIGEVDGLVNLVVNVGVKIHSFITHKSLRDMHLKIGDDVFAIFKASAVEVF
ncbi:MAG: ATP-binding cassette domain-containing protein [Candidatus Omnitrophica bacterium]|nr:ATP-binding cassette domain-containing protein [Candidatus Omnitrophota bacterium]